MEIRTDFKEVSDLLEKILLYSDEFVKHEKTWRSLKHNEDFDLVYGLPNEQRFPLEGLYEQGRDLALSMIDLLNCFNDVSACPTFVSYANHIERFLSKNVEESEHVMAVQIMENVNRNRYSAAVEEMIILSRDQVNILKGLEVWIRLAKDSRLYKEESGNFSSSTSNESVVSVHERIKLPHDGQPKEKKVSKSSEYLRLGNRPDKSFYASAKGVDREYKLQLSPNTQEYKLLLHLYNNYGTSNSKASIEDILIACDIQKHEKGEHIGKKKINHVRKVVADVRSALTGACLKSGHLKFEYDVDEHDKAVKNECCLLVHCSSK